jgi:uncharacterized SAM-binding protein YcdF (DUF218 family)
MLIVKSFATPVVWVLALLVLGLVLTRKTEKKRLFRAGRFLLWMALVLLGALSFDPVSNLLTYPLESRYRQPDPESLGKLDLIVVLGAGIYPPGHLRREAELAKHSYARFYYGVKTFRRSNAGCLVFAGGPREEGTQSEAETMKVMAVDLGIPAERIVTETQSHSTFENIANLTPLLPAGQGRRIGLVTSALHMRRSHGVFARQFPHDTIVPLPAHYAYDPTGWSPSSFVLSVGNLELSTMALHEWIGLAWYRLRDR